MATETRTKGYTFEDFCILVKDGQKADLIDGVIHMASPDNMDANDLFVWLIRLLADIVEINDLGKVNGSRAAYRLNDENSPEPDIAFVRRGRTNLIRRGFVNDAPRPGDGDRVPRERGTRLRDQARFVSGGGG